MKRVLGWCFKVIGSLLVAAALLVLLAMEACGAQARDPAGNNVSGRLYLIGAVVAGIGLLLFASGRLMHGQSFFSR